ncbi:hypothetical protein QCA50_004373 [Cerrena zonata]|uniref:GLTSCR protein conserved domain-containing protein n=1 Tax=Cerrena zonata TaxID=2478898 RepID=A0AAW0GTT2_9APHY
MSKLGEPSGSSLASSSQSATPSIHPTDLHADVLSRSATCRDSFEGWIRDRHPTDLITNGGRPTPEGGNVKVKVEAETASTSGQANTQNGDGSQVNGRQQSAPRKTIALHVDKAVNEAQRRSRLKGRGYYDEHATVQSAARVAVSLNSDQNSALNPDVDTPFRDATDVIQRLLPYHIFQHPAEDIAVLCRGSISKGKRKATEEDLLREEIAETRFALECWKRRRMLEKRFRDARTGAAQRTAPDDQAYVLAQAILESDRHENAAISAELRAAKQELEKIEREKKAAAAAANPPTPRPTYYPPQTATTPTAYPTQYRGYTYAYGQGYGSQYTYSPYQTSPVPANAWSTSVFSHTPQRSATAYTTPTTPATTSAFPSTSTPIASTSAAPSTSTPVVPQQAQQSTPAVPLTSTSPIPVQLPVSSLTDLIALGIVPVPVSSAPPAGQPQPAAVLKGTSQNGQTVSLEINVSSLQGTQLSGLAMVLSTLTSRGVSVSNTGGVNGATAASASTQPATGRSSGSSVANAPNVNGSGGSSATSTNAPTSHGGTGM